MSQKDLAQAIIKKIKKEKIKVKPKIWFTLYSTIMVLAVVTSLFILSFLLNSIIIKIQLNYSQACWHLQELFRLHFWQTFPWWQLITAIILFIISFAISLKFEFSYRIKLWHWLIIFFISVILLFALMLFSKFEHTRLYYWNQGKRCAGNCRQLSPMHTPKCNKLIK